MDNDTRIDTTVDIGADEVSCEDTSHEMDWTADGVSNYEEFALISAAWRSHDPNDPQMPPGMDPNDFVHWNSRCDLDDNYDIDLADLVIFAEDNPQNWLWVACWRKDLQPEQLKMMMSVASVNEIQMQSLSASTSLTTLAVPAEKPIREQIVELKDTIQFLERLWLEDDSIQQEIDAGEWRLFMEKVYQSMTDLQQIENPTFEIKEIKP